MIAYPRKPKELGVFLGSAIIRNINWLSREIGSDLNIAVMPVKSRATRASEAAAELSVVEDAPPAPDGASASKSRNGNRLAVEAEIEGCYAALDALTPYVTCRREQADQVRLHPPLPPPPRARAHPPSSH